MRKYDFNKVKQELTDRIEYNNNRKLIYEKTLKVLTENDIKRVDKRIMDFFNKEFENTNISLYYDSNNDYFENEKYITFYIGNDYDKQEKITLTKEHKLNGEIEDLTDLKDTCNKVIEYCKEEEENYNKDLTNLWEKVSKFNCLMEQIETWQEENKELYYIMQVEKYQHTILEIVWYNKVGAWFKMGVVFKLAHNL